MGDGKKFDCIFGFSVKSYVRNTINLSCAKILLTSVIILSGGETAHAFGNNDGDVVRVDLMAPLPTAVCKFCYQC